MLVGSVSGGLIAQVTNLGVPYVVRAAVLGVTLVVAVRFMRDQGFTPDRNVSAATAIRNVVRGAVDGGFRRPPVRWLMLAAPFSFGAGIYVFYAAQPYLLELYGDKTAYGVAGLAAAIVAGAQIVGGLIVSRVRRFFTRRTDALLIGGVLNVVLLVLVGLVSSFWIALVLLAGWALVFAIEAPLRQAFLNGLIPSEQRATVLSFDALMGSAGGVVAQPALGRTADLFGYPASYLVSAGIQTLALPFVLLARREHAISDPITDESDADTPAEPRSPAAEVDPAADAR
jgi:predicted MFS family arabinose efflux permease